jgi:16S rRNA (guanine527-N7)-methyltransferase
MSSIALLLKYFPDLTADQQQKFEKIVELYPEWNAKINVISRKDIEFLVERHILHSLAIAKVMTFEKGTKILDVGTGGGFPGLPLAILFPEVEFVLVDSIGKKILVVNEIAKAIDLKNLKAYHKRAEEVKDKFDFVVSRAVTRLENFTPWVEGKYKKNNNHPLKNGILYLKGGDIDEELENAFYPYLKFPISYFFEEEFFETKYVVHVQMNK